MRQHYRVFRMSRAASQQLREVPMKDSWIDSKPEDLSGNTFTLIGSEWMLVTAGTLERWNTMTASWGGLGVLWGKNVCFCFVRESRYTFEFMNSNPVFSLSFFADGYRNALQYCGTYSGRDVDKAAETGLSPVEIQADQLQSVTFDEARLVLLCKKLYEQDFDPACIVDETVELNYPQGDYHRFYVGEILRSVQSAT